MGEHKPVIKGPNWQKEIAALIDKDKPVLVYRNLSSKLFSVRQGTKVVCHVPYIFLRDPEFIVSANGRDKVRREKQKNVHAFVKGYVDSPRLTDHINPIGDAYYNPYTCDTFVIIENEIRYPIHKAQFAEIYVPSHITVW